jgi:hypothetical protein
LPLIPGTLKEEDHGIGLLIGNKEAVFLTAETYIFFILETCYCPEFHSMPS